MEIKYPPENPHTLTVDATIAALQTHAVAGLSGQEAARRSKTFGANRYNPQQQKTIARILLLQFKSPLVYLLAVAAAVTFYFGNNLEAISILVVIVINALIGFSMELRARSSMKALKEMDVIHSKVIRDGVERELPSEQLVPGDLVLLEAGEVLPADGRLTEVVQLQVDESSLTGESLPAVKHTAPLPAATVTGDQLNMVFKGTAIINGSGKALITAIARHTQLGHITSLVAGSEVQQTPLDRKIGALSRRLIAVTLVMTFIFALTGFLQGKHWLLILETSIALAVAAFPEGLPIVATVALAYGMLLMARRNAIVKKLPAVETLGGVNIIMTDKTGTLTENKIFADQFVFPEETVKVNIENHVLKYEAEEITKSRENFDLLILTGALCNNAPDTTATTTKTQQGDPVETAMVQLAAAAGRPAAGLRSQYRRLAEVAFNSGTKIMGTLHEGPEGQFVAAKGAVEQLLDRCTRIRLGPLVREMNSTDKKEVLSASEKMSAEGLRVLAFANSTEAAIPGDDFLHQLTYTGMTGYLDPPRLDIKDAIMQCRKAGIRIIMVTGDHPLTALNIARRVGLINAEEQRVITGSELPEMDRITDDWKQRILETDVFARTTPRQKLELVSIFQQSGQIVAMTGDGVNDAPALKKADIGIAMGLRGTQVARETAGIVLKDDSFTTIARAVAQGREIFQNIQKFVIYLISCNLSEIFIVTALGFTASASNLLALQILFLNMVTDIFPALALGLGKGDTTVMDQPPRPPAMAIISGKNWLLTVTYAVALTIAVLAVTLYCKNILHANPKVVNNAAFITLALAQLFHIFNMASASSKMLVNEITTNKFVWLAILICTGLLLLVYLLPSMRQVLGLQLLAPPVLLAALLASLLPLLLVQAGRLIWSVRYNHPANRAAAGTTAAAP